jgi:hypothetical protein
MKPRAQQLTQTHQSALMFRRLEHSAPSLNFIINGLSLRERVADTPKLVRNVVRAALSIHSSCVYKKCPQGGSASDGLEALCHAARIRIRRI